MPTGTGKRAAASAIQGTYRNTRLGQRPLARAGSALEVGDHRHGSVLAPELFEAVLLVEAGLAQLGAEADLREALVARPREQRLEELAARAAAAVARHDGDRQLGRLLVDEAEAGGRGRKQPVPGRPVGVRAREGDDAGVAAPSPVLDVAVDRQVGIAEPPVVGVAEHVAEEAHVLLVDRPQHYGRSSCASWIRLPSGS